MICKYQNSFVILMKRAIFTDVNKKRDFLVFFFVCFFFVFVFLGFFLFFCFLDFFVVFCYGISVMDDNIDVSQNAIENK